MSAVVPAPLPAGAEFVETPATALAHRFLEEAARHAGMLEIAGEGGTGKTQAVDRWFAARRPEVVKIHLENRAKGYEFLRRLVTGLGGRADGDGVALMAQLEAVVGDRMVYVFVDEADLLNRDSLRQVRYLRDQAVRAVDPLRLVFVLVGNNFRPAYALVPELYSRVTHRVSFDPLEGAPLVTALRAYHPLLAGADELLLLQIDREFCHGVWRLWANTLVKLIDYCARLRVSTRTAEAAAAALGASIGSTRPPAAGRGNARPLRAKGNNGRTARRPG